MKYIKAKYQLAEDEVCQTQLYGYNIDTPEYSLDPKGVFTAKKYFAWDGCSGSFDTYTNQRAGLFHDIGCLMVARGELPREALDYLNRLFKTHTKEDKMWKPRRGWHFKAITVHFADGKNPEGREVIELVNGKRIRSNKDDELDMWGV